MKTAYRYILPLLSFGCFFTSGEAFDGANYTSAAFRLGAAIFFMLAEIARVLRTSEKTE